MSIGAKLPRVKVGHPWKKAMPRTPAEARAAGKTTFYNGVECVHGHRGMRRETNGECMTCYQARRQGKQQFDQYR